MKAQFSHRDVSIFSITPNFCQSEWRNQRLRPKVHSRTRRKRASSAAVCSTPDKRCVQPGARIGPAARGDSVGAEVHVSSGLCAISLEKKGVGKKWAGPFSMWTERIEKIPWGDDGIMKMFSRKYALAMVLLRWAAQVIAPEVAYARRGG